MKLPDALYRNSIRIILVLLAVIFTLLVFIPFRGSPDVSPFIVPGAANMGIIHIVLFQFKADAKSEDVKAVRSQLTATVEHYSS
jgi:hypothetical protein